VVYGLFVLGWAHDFPGVGQRRWTQSQVLATKLAPVASAKRSNTLIVRSGVNAWWNSSKVPYTMARTIAHKAKEAEERVAYVKRSARMSTNVRPPYSRI
jgi:hypothetical protein